MTITFEQFERGFTAIRLSFARRTAVSIAAMEAGYEDFEMATDPVVYELQRQLQERCNDFEDDPHVGSMISYGLHEQGMCTPDQGAERFKVHDAASVWRWWQETKTGPFAEQAE